MVALTERQMAGVPHDVTWNWKDVNGSRLTPVLTKLAVVVFRV